MKLGHLDELISLQYPNCNGEYIICFLGCVKKQTPNNKKNYLTLDTLTEASSSRTTQRQHNIEELDINLLFSGSSQFNSL